MDEVRATDRASAKWPGDALKWPWGPAALANLSNMPGWRRGSVAWFGWACIAATTVGVAMGCMYAAQDWQRRAVALQVSAGARSQQPASPSVAELAISPPSDFVPSLPRTLLDLEPILVALNQRSTAAGVALISAQVLPQVSPPGALRRMDLALALRGPYGAIKEVLRETLASHRNATLRRLSLRRDPVAGGDHEVAATLVLGYWSAPELPLATSVDTASRPVR